MGILYKEKEDVKYFVILQHEDEKVKMTFSCDGGKFGTHEELDEITITPKELLDILQLHYVDRLLD